MKLFLIEQSKNTDYDTYDSAVVIANDEKEAKDMHPQDGLALNANSDIWRNSKWCLLPSDVSVTYLGESIESAKRIVCASYKAG
jgi:hypothetical protein